MKITFNALVLCTTAGLFVLVFTVLIAVIFTDGNSKSHNQYIEKCSKAGYTLDQCEFKYLERGM